VLVLGSGRLRLETERVLQEVLLFLGLPTPSVFSSRDMSADRSVDRSIERIPSSNGSEAAASLEGIRVEKYLNLALLNETLKRRFPSK